MTLALIHQLRQVKQLPLMSLFKYELSHDHDELEAYLKELFEGKRWKCEWWLYVKGVCYYYKLKIKK